MFTRKHAVFQGERVNLLRGGRGRKPRSGLVLALDHVADEVTQDGADHGADVGEIANAVGISRSSLYRLFEPYGGVMNDVRRRRLLACLRDLADRNQSSRTVADIAYSHGFSSETHFSRLFKKHFGVTPSEARHQSLDIPARGGDRNYERWIAETLI